jgi:nucleotide-binding universal stress UspA family protein
MKTEQLIWFIDSRFYFHASSLDKMVRLAKIHNKQVTVIIDASPQLTGHGYWHLFVEKDTLTNNLIADLDEKKTQLLKFFAMNAIKIDVIVNQSTNYLSLLDSEIAIKENCLVVIEDSSISKRHPIFQKLTNIKASILLLQKKIWKHSVNILAAVDPLHEHVRPGQIDDDIVSLIQLLATSLKAKWAIAHCYYVASVLTQHKNKLLLMHREGLNIFAKRLRLPDEHCILLEGTPEDALSSYIHKNQVDILVIGLVTRSKLEQLWIGSTTTTLLGEPPCDLLMININN